VTKAIKKLKDHLAEIHDLVRAASVLGWDQQTYMPRGGAVSRADQLSTLARLTHSKFTSSKTRRLLDQAAADTASLPADHDDRCLVEIVRMDLDRETKLPGSFVARWSRDASLSSEAWREARKADNFKSYRPHLKKMVGYALKAAEYYGYEDHPYDALLFDYERGMKTAEVKAAFDVLRPAQVELVRKLAERPEPRTDFLRRHYPAGAQGEFGMKIAKAFGYDTNRGRLDVAPHPFETTFSRNDVRITTRYDENFLPSSLFAIMHETGHALYEQNLSPSLDRTPLSRGCSSIFHESQSRLWENVVGRSRQFWERHYGDLRDTFPEQLSDVSLDDFYRGVNYVKPSLIRVEADEVTYNLHIMLRFEIELGLIEGQVEVKDLPELWRTKMQEYLGITPDDDKNGVMQDIHWSGGAIGYFPTYALGNVMGAQIYETVMSRRPETRGELARGEYAGLLGWLKDNLYAHGRKFMPRDLALKVNGKPLDPQPYLRYLTSKFGEIYGV
jgi:carboxypeptidase Taq